MKLRSYAVDVVELPLRVPFRTALRSTSTVTDIRVTLETEDGITGVGSASPTPAITGDTTGSITAALREHILPALMGVDLEDMEAASTAIQRSIVHNTSAKAAADIAWHDLLARRAAKPLTRWLGGAGNRIVTDATVSLGAVDSMVAQARDLAEEGFRVLKIKLGNHDGLDVERIAAIRSALGQDITLRVDANQAWGVKETLRNAEALANYGVELIEQPLPAHDLNGLREVTARSAVPIAADESVYGMHDVLRVLDLRAADIINIKLMKSAGLHQARQMIQLVRAAGLDWMIGSMMEGPASVTAAAALAAAFHCRYVDLDAAYFLGHPQASGGLAYAGPTGLLPDESGLGVTFTSTSHQTGVEQ